MTSVRIYALAAAVGFAAGLASAEQPRVWQDEKGRIRVTPLPIEQRFVNPWPNELQEEFYTRADYAIRKNAVSGNYGNTWFENEKSSYPRAMMDFLNGNREKAIKFLETDNADGEDCKHTRGIDFYPCFTLKGQMRKYFFFNEFLSDKHKQDMFEGGRLWSEKDPIGRPHPLHGMGDRSKPGWRPDARGNWADGRNTDNLRAMRECAVYLMAEETGNKETADIYRKKIQRYVWALYNVGMGEWDSENYLGHTMTGYIQLYDFAKDPEMRLLGKAAMDWLCTAAAVKYYRGGFGGPDKRDYNKPLVFQGSAADHAHLWFGDAPTENPSPAHDQVHFITSAYRPPAAVVALARKQFDRPCELLISHPTYETWKQDGDQSHAPEFYETQYYGKTFQFGTLVRGSGGDVNGFKMMAFNSKRGVDYLVAANVVADGVNDTSPTSICAPGATTGHNAVAQYRNMAIWLNNKGDSAFMFLLPKRATIETQGGVMFLAYEKTHVAIRPIGLKIDGVSEELTKKVNFKHDKKGQVVIDKKTSEPTPHWIDEQIITARGDGSAGYCGFVVEIGEGQDLAAFKKAVLAGKVDTSKLGEGLVTYTAADGASVGVQNTGTWPANVWRNGKLHDWKTHWPQYHNADGGEAPIHLGWKEGVLRVEAGGQVFTGELKDGKYRFSNEMAK